MSWLDRAGLYLFDVVVLIIVVSGLASAVSGSARRFLLNRLGGGIFKAITESARGEQQRAELKAQTAAALRQALIELSEQVATGYRADKPLGRIRTLCPEARKSCDVLAAAYDDGVSRARADFYPMLDAIRDAAAGCLSV